MSTKKQALECINDHLKYCCGCKSYKLKSCFQKNSRLKDGLQQYCKDCRRRHAQGRDTSKIKEYQKEYYFNNKEIINYNKKIYYENNKEYFNIKSKEYSKINKEKIKENKKIYSQLNKEDIARKRKEYDKLHKEKKKIYDKEYGEKNKEKRKILKKEYYKKNKEKFLEKSKEYSVSEKGKAVHRKARKKYKSKIHVKIRNVVSMSIRLALKKNDKSKSKSSVWKVLPYSPQELFDHLQMQMIDNNSWMNSSNHGIYNPSTWNDDDQSTWKWQIDHIIPHSDLPYDNIDHPNFQKCWSLDNLRPLNAKQNVLDGVRRIRHAKKE